MCEYEKVYTLICIFVLELVKSDSSKAEVTIQTLQVFDFISPKLYKFLKLKK